MKLITAHAITIFPLVLVVYPNEGLFFLFMLVSSAAVALWAGIEVGWYWGSK